MDNANFFEFLPRLLPVGVFRCDAYGRCVYANGRCAEIAGVPLQSLRGTDWTECVHPDDRQRLRDLRQRARQEGKPYEGEIRLLRPNGSVTWVLVQTRAERDERGDFQGFVGTMTDISTLKQTQQSLTQSEERFRLLFEHNAVPLAIWKQQDGDFVLEEYNAALDRIARGTMHKLLGLPARDVYAGDPRILQAFDQCLRSKQPVHQELAYCFRMTGEVREARIHYVFVPPGQIVVHIEDVSEYKRIQHELQASNKRLQDILDGMSVFVALFTPDRMLIETNQLLLHESGLTREEAMATPCWALTPFVACDDSPARLKTAMERAAAGETMRFDAAARLRGGKLATIEISLSPLRDSQGKVVQLVGTGVDVTGRKLVEEQLRASRQQLQTVVSNAPVILFALDKHGRFTLSDGLGLTSIGLAPGELVGQSVFDLYANHPEVTDAVQRSLLGEEVSLVLETHNQVFDVRYCPLRSDDGTVTGVIGVGSNITERKHAEDQARQLQQELAHFGRLCTMGQMAAGIAHELNQPLASIATQAYSARELLDRHAGSVAEALRPFLDAIEEQSLRAGEIIRRFRQLARRSTSHGSPCALQPLIREVIDMVAPDLRLAGIACEVEFEKGLPDVVVDRIQIQQVLLNLVRNAMDSLREAPRENRRITAEARTTGAGQVEVLIRDSGIGIPEGDNEKIFQPLHSTKVSGLGLGLTISRNIIEAHGGRLELVPVNGPGALFRFTLPEGATKGGADVQ